MDQIERLRQRLTDAALRAAVQVEGDLKGSLATPYPPASEPGETPHRRSGKLQADANVHIDQQGDVIGIQAEASPEYAFYLEYGTEKMDPRPFMRPSREHARQIVSNALRGAGGLQQ